MDVVDDILGTKSNNNNYQNNKYTNNHNNKYKNNWQEQQNKERQRLIDTMDNMAVEIISDTQKFKQYLDIQSRFEKHSVGNCLLILNKNPNVTLLREKKSWNDKGIKVISDNCITILEANKSNTYNKTFYNPKKLYDISETNAPKQDNTVNYDTKKLLESFFYNCMAEKEAVDELPNGSIGAEYNKEENKLYVCRGMDIELLFQTVSQELANIEMRTEDDSEFKGFKSYCISYMLCKKYGIDVSNYSFTELPIELTEKTKGKEIRKELDKVRIDYETINSRIQEYFENRTKERKSQSLER